mmetsp:Transcript_77659/g.251270  ORF Transcript_77659/g.251270 Transcript_77659/m.251270 type:complete len:489 (-) Transcript_77659:252-1718(-)
MEATVQAKGHQLAGSNDLHQQGQVHLLHGGRPERVDALARDGVPDGGHAVLAGREHVPGAGLLLLLDAGPERGAEGDVAHGPRGAAPVTALGGEPGLAGLLGQGAAAAGAVGRLAAHAHQQHGLHRLRVPEDPDDGGRVRLVHGAEVRPLDRPLHLVPEQGEGERPRLHVDELEHLRRVVRRAREAVDVGLDTLMHRAGRRDGRTRVPEVPEGQVVRAEDVDPLRLAVTDLLRLGVVHDGAVRRLRVGGAALHPCRVLDVHHLLQAPREDTGAVLLQDVEARGHKVAGRRLLAVSELESGGEHDASEVVGPAAVAVHKGPEVVDAAGVAVGAARDVVQPPELRQAQGVARGDEQASAAPEEVAGHRHLLHDGLPRVEHAPPPLPHARDAEALLRLDHRVDLGQAHGGAGDEVEDRVRALLRVAGQHREAQHGVVRLALRALVGDLALRHQALGDAVQVLLVCEALVRRVRVLTPGEGPEARVAVGRAC